MPFSTYSESPIIVTKAPGLSAFSASIAARSSMRLFVVVGSRPHTSFVRPVLSLTRTAP